MTERRWACPTCKDKGSVLMVNKGRRQPYIGGYAYDVIPCPQCKGAVDFKEVQLDPKVLRNPKNPLKCLNCGTVYYMGVGSVFTFCPKCKKPWKGIVTPYPKVIIKRTGKNPVTAILVRLYKPIMAECNICGKRIASWEKYYIYDKANGRFYHLKCFQASRKKGKKNPTLSIPITSEKQKGHVFQAEDELSKAGVTFDTGYGGGMRDWELDWSLEGATLRNPRKPISPSRKFGSGRYERLQETTMGRGLAETMAKDLRAQGAKVRVLQSSVKGYYYIFVKDYQGNPTGYKVKCPKCGSYDTDTWKKSGQRFYICYKCHHEWKGRYGIDNPTSKLYRNFHGTDPVKTSTVLYEPPPNGEPLIKIGRLSQINYVPEGPSHKAGHEFYHKSGDLGHKTIKSNAILATNQQGTQLFIVREKDSKYPLFTERGIIG